MNKVVDISKARTRKEQSAKEIREEIIAFSEKPQFPGRHIIDQGTQSASLDEAAETELSRMFELFGVTHLSPLNPDFDLVSNTWYELNRVGLSLKSRLLFETTLYTAQLRIWHPDYVAYLNSLWNGNLSDIGLRAKVLNIQAGIPESASRLKDGPISA